MVISSDGSRSRKWRAGPDAISSFPVSVYPPHCQVHKAGSPRQGTQVNASEEVILS